MYVLSHPSCHPSSSLASIISTLPLSLHSLTLSTLIFIMLATLPLCHFHHCAAATSLLPPLLLSSQHFATECCGGGFCTPLSSLPPPPPPCQHPPLLPASPPPPPVVSTPLTLSSISPALSIFQHPLAPNSTSRSILSPAPTPQLLQSSIIPLPSPSPSHSHPVLPMHPFSNPQLFLYFPTHSTPVLHHLFFKPSQFLSSPLLTPFPFSPSPQQSPSPHLVSLFLSSPYLLPLFHPPLSTLPFPPPRLSIPLLSLPSSPFHPSPPPPTSSLYSSPLPTLFPFSPFPSHLVSLFLSSPYLLPLFHPPLSTLPFPPPRLSIPLLSLPSFPFSPFPSPSPPRLSIPLLSLPSSHFHPSPPPPTSSLYSSPLPTRFPFSPFPSPSHLVSLFLSSPPPSSPFHPSPPPHHLVSSLSGWYGGNFGLG
ncbi:hypothetical protein Pcinc_012820 [Petrolisthes cinctipes]|uniref:Uncharacterized protein n=1 Tax=Petrolisthes cinctipes TaxID=88211 RepID=A0AAE1G3W7_PETCI|nr:hypothetical protein Pcinc_012820 [Petrolisthes cinctipes]